MNPFSKGEYCNITVRNARTHIEEGRAKFTDYEIELKTNHISFAVKQSKVRRRYSDFVWLRDRLAKDLMTCDAPSLPGRRLFGRFNTDFIKQRQRRLQDFLTKVIKNNVFLSHAALHLFLQTKMSIEEIQEQIDSKNDEDACDRILSESAFKEPTEQRDRLPSKHDSGIESCGHDDGDVGDLSTIVADTGEETEKLVDGNTADSEDNAEYENEASDNNNTDEDQLEDDFRRRLYLSSLPTATAEKEANELESSVEFSPGRTTDSEPNDDVIDEDEEAQISIRESYVRKYSNGSFRKPRRRRSKRRRRTCIPQFNLSEDARSKEKGLSSPGPFHKEGFVRRCFSFDMFNRSSSMFDMKKQASSSSSRNIDCDSQNIRTSRNSLCRSYSSRFSESEDRYKLRCSGSEERFRSPVKRKISLKEYHIVRRDACFHVSMDEKDFNSSF